MSSFYDVVVTAWLVVFIFWLGFITGVVTRSRDITESKNSRRKEGSDVKSE